MRPILRSSFSNNTQALFASILDKCYFGDVVEIDMSRGSFESEGYHSGRVQPHRGTLVLVLGILSLVVCAPLGIAAWIMGSNDLAAMRAGRMDPSGESMTQVGYVLGIIGTVFFGIGIVAACLWFAAFGMMVQR
ncbi:MAG: hypothetical protein KatS3mg105_1472 [Gemmatales bacterium]|nr:MAG: hypothetical protein KatS3mg105_1472 [Gemmatales bacterium]